MVAVTCCVLRHPSAVSVRKPRDGSHVAVAVLCLFCLVIVAVILLAGCRMQHPSLAVATAAVSGALVVAAHIKPKPPDTGKPAEHRTEPQFKSSLLAGEASLLVPLWAFPLQMQ